jgi:hypothetical protein
MPRFADREVVNAFMSTGDMGVPVQRGDTA